MCKGHLAASMNWVEKLYLSVFLHCDTISHPVHERGRKVYSNFSWVCETSSLLEPFIAFSSPTPLCYLQLPGCKRETGKNKTAGSGLLYTGWKKFWRRLCDNSFQDSCSGYLGVSMLDLIADSSFQKRTDSTSNCCMFLSWLLSHKNSVL